MDFDERRERLAHHLGMQIQHIAKQVHAAVCGHNAPCPEVEVSPAAVEDPRRPRGLWGLTGRSRSVTPSGDDQTGLDPAQKSGDSSAEARGTEAPSSSGRSDSAGAASVTMEDVTATLQERMGFSLHLAPSAVGHADAGEGLWLRGRAKTGAVVGLYPGIVYTRADYRDMPGYPKVDNESDFLISRFDGAILDAKPWGRASLEEPQAAASLGYRERLADTLAQLHGLERRHPFSLAHYANHPPAGRRPNIMIAAYDFREEDSLRRYIPNVMFRSCPATPLDSPAFPGTGEKTLPSRPLLGLALVATREIEDEELLLNYRLSPGLARPSWYTAVDEAEDSRRWS
ncbi:hypothetical protein WJX75_004261 [Coccomyxa subellipsoidea]|uniref:SET domain-containing protein n=1 Tax=Coccomyxa subellipsoidea TaxID=248742 RepID=A0ABR2YCX7_9CHLO